MTDYQKLEDGEKIVPKEPQEPQEPQEPKTTTTDVALTMFTLFVFCVVMYFHPEAMYGVERAIDEQTVALVDLATKTVRILRPKRSF